jgi:DNA-binding TFAR19-related protein (PDSD5 family)
MIGAKSLIVRRGSRLCERGCRLVWSRLEDLGSLDPGSNPGSPTTFTYRFHQVNRTVKKKVSANIPLIVGQKNVYQFDGHYYPAMSDADLAAIREKKLREYQRRLGPKENKPEPAINEDEALNRIFRDRAWEVFRTASQQFPEEMKKVKTVLVKLASSGKLNEVTGEELFLFLRKLGLDVRLNTKISYASHGELKSLEEKMREEMRGM